MRSHGGVHDAPAVMSEDHQHARSRPLQHLQLMPEREDLEVQRGTSPDQASERSQNGNQHRHHRDQSLPVPIGKFNAANRCGVFGRHTRSARQRSRSNSSSDTLSVEES